MDEPTRDEILKVRRWECEMRGHSWEVIEVLGQVAPQGVTCRNCGLGYPVVDPSTVSL